MKKKKKLLIICISLLVLIGLIILFASKIQSKEKQKENENNYTIKFDYYDDEELSQRITFIYKDKKLSDITITLYFDSKETAKAVYKEYKSYKEFKKYETKSNRVILYYKDSDVNDYKSYTKDELIVEFISLGYVHTGK